MHRGASFRLVVSMQTYCADVVDRTTTKTAKRTINLWGVKGTIGSSNRDLLKSCVVDVWICCNSAKNHACHKNLCPPEATLTGRLGQSRPIRCRGSHVVRLKYQVFFVPVNLLAYCSAGLKIMLVRPVKVK